MCNLVFGVNWLVGLLVWILMMILLVILCDFIICLIISFMSGVLLLVGVYYVDVDIVVIDIGY